MPSVFYCAPLNRELDKTIARIYILDRDLDRAELVQRILSSFMRWIDEKDNQRIAKIHIKFTPFKKKYIYQHTCLNI